MKIGIVVATFRRPHIIRDFLRTLAAQTRQPDHVVFSIVDDSDLPDLGEQPFPVTVVSGSPGSCVQRNRGIDRLAGTVDAIVFLDDDFWMSRFYLQAVETILESDASIVGMTGHVLADGATTAGISVAEADAMLQEADKAPQPQQRRRDVADTYGCNMAFRASAIGAIRFDERMPLYGWQEDVDFSAQVGRGARTIWTDELRGVHLGTKSGKTSGVRFGFSQAVNPLYVCSKGNMPLHRAGKLIAKNVLANAAKSFAPEPNIDRRGRLRGNLLGFAHLISGKLKPEHVLTL